MVVQAEICLIFFQDRKVTLGTGSSNYNTISVVLMHLPNFLDMDCLLNLWVKHRLIRVCECVEWESAANIYHS